MTQPDKVAHQGPWTLSERVVFECALSRDDGADWQTLKARDAAIAAAAPGLEGKVGAGERRALARHWLARRLRQDSAIPLAASALEQSLKAAGHLLCVFALLSGLIAATAALAYTGQEPINVSAFFGLFVLLQGMVALLFLLATVIPWPRRGRDRTSPLLGFARSLFRFALERSLNLATRFLEGKQRQNAAEAAGLARSRLLVHRDLFQWLAFSKLQSAALFFNAGVLSALLLAVAFSDRAFGWQTTLDVSPEAVHRLARSVAAPWTPLWGEGAGYPTPTEIEGSRIVLKEGMRTLQTANLVAWWQFLALGIVFYGLMPRLILRFIGGYRVRKAVREYDFSDAAASGLLERLVPAASPFATGSAAGPSEPVPIDTAQNSVAPPSPWQHVTCLVDRDLAQTLDLDRLRAELARRWGLEEAKIATVVYDRGQIGNSMERNDNSTQFAFVFESWMPPIKETERTIRALRDAIDPRSPIRLVPLDLPPEPNAFPQVALAPNYDRMWDALSRRMGDPYLALDRSGS